MMNEFIFWAQALDNTSPDHIEMNGEEIPAVDPARRQKAVSTVGAVSRSSRFSIECRDVRLAANSTHFVVEVPSVELDTAGRIAPLICYGPHHGYEDKQLGVKIVEGVLGFADRLGRNVSADNISDAHQALANLRAALKRAERMRKIAMGSVAVVGALVLARCLTTEKHSPDDMGNPDLARNHLEGRRSR